MASLLITNIDAKFSHYIVYYLTMMKYMYVYTSNIHTH
jgi:hypothetical protein